MDAVPTHTGRRRAFEAEGTKMQRMGRGLCGHRKQSLRKEKKVQWGVWFFSGPVLYLTDLLHPWSIMVARYKLGSKQNLA